MDSGRVRSRTKTVEEVSTELAYDYDALGRLVSVTKDGTLVEEYRFGPSGNRTFERNLLRGITGRTFTYSDEDHLLASGDTTCQYDADGFLTSKTRGSQVTEFRYSSRGELLSATFSSGTVIEYLHDPLGRRIGKKVNGTVTEKYLWQGMTRLLAVYDGRDNLFMRFQYADSRMPVSMTRGATNYCLTYDQVGSLRTVSDTTGSLVKRIDYDSFGNILSDSNPSLSMPFGFAGGIFDPHTTLVRFGFRDYDPDTGRWTAKDPILFGGEDTNLYGYVQNDPVNFADPDGEHPVLAALLAGAYYLLAGGGLDVGNAPTSPSATIYSSTPDILYGEIPVLGAAGLTAYRVGIHRELQCLSSVGDDLALHHVGQAHVMQQVAPGFTRAGGASIALPTAEHLGIPTLKGSFEGSARSLLARDISNLRNYTNAPNSSLIELIRLNKQLYPGSFTK